MDVSPFPPKRYATTHNQQSPLFRLPGELRNRIYDYVLTEGIVEVEEDIDLIIGPTGLFRLYPVYGNSRLWNTELNVLQYVCRQIYYETRGLGLRNNTLHFTMKSTHTSPPSINCACFLSCCSASSITDITRIIIVEAAREVLFEPWTMLFDLNGIEQLTKICLANPHIQIGIYLQSLTNGLGIHAWVERVCILLLAVRKRRLNRTLRSRSYESYSIDDIVQCMAASWDGFADDAGAFPTNLVFFPIDPYEAAIWERYRIKSPGLYYQWILQIQEWYENGI